jgi:hypothetical protein
LERGGGEDEVRARHLTGSDHDGVDPHGLVSDDGGLNGVGARGQRVAAVAAVEVGGRGERASRNGDAHTAEGPSRFPVHHAAGDAAFGPWRCLLRGGARSSARAEKDHREDGVTKAHRNAEAYAPDAATPPRRRNGIVTHPHFVLRSWR